MSIKHRVAETTVTVKIGSTMAQVRRTMVMAALTHHDGDIKKAAEALGMERPRLHRMISDYGLKVR